MKKTDLLIITTLLSMVFVSCGNNNGRKLKYVPLQRAELEAEIKAPIALDPYTCLLHYFKFHRPVDFPESYGYSYSGSYQNSNGGNDYIIIKNCSYDRNTRQYLGIGDNSAGINITFMEDTGNYSLWQFVKNVVERDAIFERLVNARFEKESLGNNMYHFSNGILGIDCQLENDVWIFRTMVYGDEDYFFKAAKTCAEYKDLINNQVKFINNYRGKRFRIKGKVTKIDEYAFDSQKVQYYFAEGYFFVRVPKYEAFYDLMLPTELTISGIVKSADNYGLDLENVLFYDERKNEYLGYNKPMHRTETNLDAPKVYQRHSSVDGVTTEPKVAAHGESGLKVTKVMVTEEETILDFTTDARVSGNNSYYEWCCIDPDAYIIANGQRFAMTRAEGIEKAPGKTYFPKLTMSLDFRLHFPAIPKTTAKIDFSETGDSSWWIKGIELNVPANESVADYEFTGFLSDGAARYGIEMKLYCVNGYQYEGYYRYLSQPKDIKIPVEGEIGFESGSFANIESFYLFSAGGTERFDFDLEGKTANGIWTKYETAEDCEWGGNDYTKKMKLSMTLK